MKPQQDGVKHTRYTFLVQLDPRSVLRTQVLHDMPGKKRNFDRDSISVMLVCHRPGKVPGQIEFLAHEYRNGDRGVTFRFPTETGEQELNETPHQVALACLQQEIFGPENTFPAVIGVEVKKLMKPGDVAHLTPQRPIETLSPPKWYEASDLMDWMQSRGIKSHRDGLIAAVEYLASQDRRTANTYFQKLDDWKKL